MSKFENICTAYSNAVNEYDTYENESKLFLDDLANKLISYFEIPPKHLSIIPAKDDQQYSSTLELEEDLFWHSGLLLTIYNNVNTYPHIPIKIKIRFKKEIDNSYSIHFSDIEKAFIIIPSDISTYNLFFDAIYKNMVDNFDNNLNTIIKNVAAKKIGFKL